MPIAIEYLVALLLLIVIALAVWLIMLDRRLTKLLRGGKTKTLEESVISLEQEAKASASFRKNMETYLRDVEKRLKRSVQSISTVRFQAFKGIGGGGNQSFASALINEKGDGVVISSIYSRELIGIYAKPVKKKTTELELTAEENRALETALAELKQ